MALTATKAEKLTTEEKAAVLEAVIYRLSVISGHLAAINTGMEREAAREVKKPLRASKQILLSARKKIPGL